MISRKVFPADSNICRFSRFQYKVHVGNSPTERWYAAALCARVILPAWQDTHEKMLARSCLHDIPPDWYEVWWAEDWAGPDLGKCVFA